MKKDASSNRGLVFRITWPTRVIAFITLWAFLFTSIEGPSLLREACASAGPIHSGSIQVPSHLGNIRSSWSSVNGPLVIHIQDAHCNYYAQKSISEIISYFRDNYGTTSVNLEGGSADYDLSPLTKIIDPKVRIKACEYFSKEGLLNGAEYLAANDPKKIDLWGVEDVKLYRDNLTAYRGSLANKNKVREMLRSISAGLARAKLQTFSADLLEFDKNHNRYKSENVDFKEYAAYLIASADRAGIGLAKYPNISILVRSFGREEGIDFRAADKQRDELIDSLQKTLSMMELEELIKYTVDLKAGRIGQKSFYTYLVQKTRSAGIDVRTYSELEKYVSYVSAYEGIDKESLIEEIEALESEARGYLCKTDADRRLCVISKDLAILKNFFAATLTPDEYGYYKQNRSSFEAANFAQFSGSNVSGLDQMREQMERFYVCSLVRDEAFVKNLKFSGNKTAILVTGGFHTENLEKLFRKNNISYVSIMPSFKECGGYKCQYFDILSGARNTDVKTMIQSAINSNLAIADPWCPAMRIDPTTSPTLRVRKPDKISEEQRAALTEGFFAKVDELFANRRLMDDAAHVIKTIDGDEIEVLDLGHPEVQKALRDIEILKLDYMIPTRHTTEELLKQAAGYFGTGNKHLQRHLIGVSADGSIYFGKQSYGSTGNMYVGSLFLTDYCRYSHLRVKIGSHPDWRVRDNGPYLFPQIEKSPAVKAMENTRRAYDDAGVSSDHFDTDPSNFMIKVTTNSDTYLTGVDIKYMDFEMRSSASAIKGAKLLSLDISVLLLMPPDLALCVLTLFSMWFLYRNLYLPWHRARIIEEETHGHEKLQQMLESYPEISKYLVGITRDPENSRPGDPRYIVLLEFNSVLSYIIRINNIAPIASAISRIEREMKIKGPIVGRTMQNPISDDEQLAKHAVDDAVSPAELVAWVQRTGRIKDVGIIKDALKKERKYGKLEAFGSLLMTIDISTDGPSVPMKAKEDEELLALQVAAIHVRAFNPGEAGNEQWFKDVIRSQKLVECVRENRIHMEKVVDSSDGKEKVVGYVKFRYASDNRPAEIEEVAIWPERFRGSHIASRLLDRAINSLLERSPGSCSFELITSAKLAERIYKPYFSHRQGPNNKSLWHLEYTSGPYGTGKTIFNVRAIVDIPGTAVPNAIAVATIIKSEYPDAIDVHVRDISEIASKRGITEPQEILRMYRERAKKTGAVLLGGRDDDAQTEAVIEDIPSNRGPPVIRIDDIRLWKKLQSAIHPKNVFYAAGYHLDTDKLRMGRWMLRADIKDPEERKRIYRQLKANWKQSPIERRFKILIFAPFDNGCIEAHEQLHQAQVIRSIVDRASEGRGASPEDGLDNIFHDGTESEYAARLGKIVNAQRSKELSRCYHLLLSALQRYPADSDLSQELFAWIYSTEKYPQFIGTPSVAAGSEQADYLRNYLNANQATTTLMLAPTRDFIVQVKNHPEVALFLSDYYDKLRQINSAVTPPESLVNIKPEARPAVPELSMVRETARTLKRNTTDIVIMPYSSGYHAKQTAKAREIVGPMNKADVGLTTIPMYYIYDGDWHKSIKTVIENACLRMIEAGDRSRALIYVPDGARGMAMDIIRDSEHFALLERFSFITEEGLAENALIDVGQHIMIGKSFLNYERNVEIGNDVTKETACLLGYLKSIAAIPPDSGPEAINDLLRGLRLLRIAPINIDQIDDRARAYRIALESA